MALRVEFVCDRCHRDFGKPTGTWLPLLQVDTAMVDSGRESLLARRGVGQIILCDACYAGLERWLEAGARKAVT